MASLVLGILGIVMCPLILSIPAIILGNQAKARIANQPALQGEGMAKTGVILGWIGVGLASLGILFLLVALAADVGTF